MAKTQQTHQFLKKSIWKENNIGIQVPSF
jgi:hypothetical protein